MTPEQAQLVETRLRDAERMAAKFWRRGSRFFEFEELAAEARVALVEAVIAWDQEKAPGSKFNFFLAQRVKWHLIKVVDQWRGGQFHQDMVRAGRREKTRSFSLDSNGFWDRKTRHEFITWGEALPDSRLNAEQEMLLHPQRQYVQHWLTHEGARFLSPLAIERFKLLMTGMTLAQLGETCGISRQAAFLLFRKVAYLIRHSRRNRMPV